MDFRALIIFVIATKSAAYLKEELSQSCLERGFHLTYNSTPDTCYLRRSSSVAMAWSASWSECSSLGSGDGLKTEGPHAPAPQRRGPGRASRQTARRPHLDQCQSMFVLSKAAIAALVIEMSNARRMYARIERHAATAGADYFAPPPAWLRLTQLSFPGIRGQFVRYSMSHCLTWVGRGEGVAGAFVGRYAGDPADSYYPNLVHHTANGNSRMLVCQLQAFSAGSGVLVRQKGRATGVLDEHRLRAFPAASLATCSLACLRTGLCFGLGFGGGRCELYRLAAAEMVGGDAGWGPTPEGLYFYAFDWPIRR